MTLIDYKRIMPLSCERIIIATEEKEPLPLVHAGSHREIPFEHATAHIFCEPTDDGVGIIRFSGHVEDLTYIFGDNVKAVEPDQALVVTKDGLTVFDDKTALVARYTNVLAESHKHVRADQT